MVMLENNHVIKIFLIRKWTHNYHNSDNHKRMNKRDKDLYCNEVQKETKGERNIDTFRQGSAVCQYNSSCTELLSARSHFNLSSSIEFVLTLCPIDNGK